MDQDRIEGSGKTLGGRVKEFLGRMFGDTRLRTEGKMDQAEGRIQNTVGGLKDSLRDDGRRNP